jgi:hypothetical protein
VIITGYPSIENTVAQGVKLNSSRNLVNVFPAANSGLSNTQDKKWRLVGGSQI